MHAHDHPAERPQASAAQGPGRGAGPARPTVQDPLQDAGVHLELERMSQIVLFNDDHNAMEHVVRCLIRVFGHPEGLAIKIMVEAQERGRAIAEVEGASEARLHRQQLQSFGLTAEIEPV